MLDENIKLPEENDNLIQQNSENSETPSKEIVEENSNSSKKAIDEIDDKIAESSEIIEHDKLDEIDYTNLSLEDLVAELNKLVKESPVQSIQNNVNNIKSIFNVKFGEILKKEKSMALVALKSQAGLSNKGWDKGIKGYKGF